MFALELFAYRLQQCCTETSVLRQFHRKRVQRDVYVVPVQHVRLCDINQGLVEGPCVTLATWCGGDREMDGLPVVSIQFAHQRRQEER